MKNYEPFEGVIGRTLAESTPWWPTPPIPATTPPTWSSSCWTTPASPTSAASGPTSSRPTSTRLAARGLRYTNFHVTPLCSPTRAALLTGRNHHTVGMRSLSNFDSGYPHMRGYVTNHAATVAEVLRDAGYATFAAGQVAPVPHGERVGRRSVRPVALPARLRPLLRLPRGRDRPVPSRARLRQPLGRAAGHPRRGVPPERGPRRPRHRVHPRHQVDPPRPALLHLPGLRGHARPPSGAGRPISSATAAGSTTAGTWPATGGSPASRSSGSSPETRLAPRNPGVEPWDSLPENHRRLAARLQEAFAAFLEHTDAQIGRLVDRPRGARRDGQHHSSCCCPTTVPARRAGPSASCTR